ncbi:acyltransferase domain-containing protein [Streptomyces sp. I3(2020)]|nr:acyltransferase domain-containing protein [Streptomyces sp. I3(2020)]
MRALSPLPPSPAEPVAVVGIGCRFAGGADSPQALWELLTDAVSTSGPIPDDRWAAHRARSREDAAVLTRVTANGSFLDDISGFDASFFGISATEARQLDPQQRIALEVAWEALEHAGIPAPSLAGTDTGVFIGVGTDDYGRRLLEDLPGVEAWTGIGSSLCGVPNRISYTLDLRGPSLAVDTACSSSLVAVHQACAALRAGEVPVALAGGVMLMAGPGLTTVLDLAGAISPDGRSKAFDDAADGYGRGEGCGIVVLKLLSHAARDGDRVLALIRGSAVHQDGRTDGIMAPSPTAQAHLLRRAYEAAGVIPGQVDYVEAHGTGTRLGDPIEAAALAEVVGDRADEGRPCLVGSVKTNIGHCEAAAGIAGLIKTTLALEHGVIPPTLSVAGPREQIPWDTSGLRLVTESTPWPDTGRPRLAGVASYGYGGTIAHVVLEQAPRPAGPVSGTADGPTAGTAPATGPAVHPLSSATVPGLAAQARRLLGALDAHDVADIGHTLAHRRAHLGVRAAVLASTRDELARGLAALTEGRPDPAVVTGESAGPARHPVWVFSGHGAQWAGMGRELLADEPVFAAAIDRLGPVYAKELGVTPREVLGAGTLGSVDIVQSMLFAVQIGLAEVWRHHGVRPGAVIGHSVGEIAAAVTAGVLTEEDGARLVCRRSALLRGAAGKGAMIMVDRPFDEVRTRIGTDTTLCAAIAAAPSSTVVAGDVPAVERAAETWAGQGWTVRRIDSDVAFHSPHMDGPAAELAAAVAGLDAREPRVPLYLTATDDPRARRRQDASYWADNLRNPVRFHQAVQAAVEDGHRLFLEISAHPVVSHSVTEAVAALPGALVTPSLRRDKPEKATLLASLAALHCHGVPVDWSVLQPAGNRTDLPVTAWRHERHWVDPREQGAEPPVDTLLGTPTAVHGSRTRVWQTTLDLRTRPYPRRHPVLGTEIVPAAVLLNTFLTAARTDQLTDVRLRQPVVVPQQETRELQVVHDENGLRLASRRLGAPDTAWVTHTLAALDPAGPVLPVEATDAAEELPPGYVVDRLAELGVADMGYPWTVHGLRRGEGVLTAAADAPLDRSWAAVLDAALSMASVVFPGPGVLRMPARIDRVVRAGAPPRRAGITVRVDAERPTTVHVDIRGVAADGSESVLSLRGLHYGELDGDLSGSAEEQGTGGRFEVAWRPFPVDTSARTTLLGRTVLVLGPTELARSLVPEAAAHGATVSVDRAALADADHVLFAPAGFGSATPLEPADVAAGFTRLVADIAALPGTGRCCGASPPGCARRPGPAPSPRRRCGAWAGSRPANTPSSGAASSTARRAASPNSPPGCCSTCCTSGRRTGHVAHRRRGRRAAADTGRPGTRRRAVRLPPGRDVPDHRWARRARARARRPPRRTRRAPDRPAGTHPDAPRARWSDDDPRVRAVRRLEAAGVTVRTVAADITDAAATRRTLDSLDLPPVRGVVHAAGTVHSALLHRLTEDDLRAVMRPKADGARVLHELFPPGSTDFFVLFSSAGPLLGLPGQGAYAAANTFLDVLAAHRRATGHAESVSLAWTSWRGLGMATAAAATEVELHARGTTDVAPDLALRAFDHTVARPDSALVAVLGLLRGHGGPRPALLAELASDEVGQPSQVPDWVGLTGDELAAYLLDEVRARVAAVLGVQPAAVGVHRPLTEAGVDSLLAAAVRVALERDLGIALPATLLWNYPTVGEIAGYLTVALTDAHAVQEQPTA